MISGVLGIKSSKVHLLKWAEYPDDWPSEQDSCPPVLEALHQLIQILNQYGESVVGNLISLLPKRSAAIRLADDYARLFFAEGERQVPLQALRPLLGRNETVVTYVQGGQDRAIKAWLCWHSKTIELI